MYENPNWYPLTPEETEQFEAEYAPLRDRLQQLEAQGAPAAEIERVYAQMDAVIDKYI